MKLSSRPVSGPEVEHLHSEIEALREELERAQKDKNKQDTLIRSLKDVRRHFFFQTNIYKFIS